MLPIRFTPGRMMTSLSDEFTSLQREMNRLFADAFRGWADDAATVAAWTPAVDIHETKDHYEVNVELPGVRKDDVKITLESNVLTISGEKKEERDEKNADYRRVERAYGSFYRSFTLPSTVKSDKIEAAYKDGVLNVVIPKAEEAKPKQIEVKVK